MNRNEIDVRCEATPAAATVAHGDGPRAEAMPAVPAGPSLSHGLHVLSAELPPSGELRFYPNAPLRGLRIIPGRGSSGGSVSVRSVTLYCPEH